MFGLLLVFLLCYKTIICYNNQDKVYNASRELHEILKSPTYHADDRPISNTTDGSVNVKVQMSVLAIGPIDSKSFTFRIDYFLRLWWKDERLKFSKGKVTFTGNPKGKFWVPDLYTRNSREVKPHSLGETYRTVISSDGSMYWSTRVSEVCSCKMDLHNFPMDEQVCKMVLESYAYHSKELTLDWNKIPVEEGDLEVNDFEVKEMKAVLNSVQYIIEDRFDHLELRIHIRRTITNYISRIYVPSTALVVMTWGTFWLPISTYPARIAVIVTNFLASILLLRSSDQYTKVPYTTAIDVFFIVNTVFIVASIIEYMITIHYRRVRNLRLRHGKLQRDFELSSIKEKEKQKQKEQEKEKKSFISRSTKKKPKIPHKERTPLTDQISRYLFPISYSLFMIIYFSFYLSRY